MSEIHLLRKMVLEERDPRAIDALSRELALREVKRLLNGTIEKAAKNMSEEELLKSVIATTQDFSSKDVLIHCLEKLQRGR